MISQNNNKLCSEIISLVESDANAMETFVSDIGQEYKILKPLLTGETKLDNDMWWSGYTNWSTGRVSLERLMLKLSW